MHTAGLDADREQGAGHRIEHVESRMDGELQDRRGWVERRIQDTTAGRRSAAADPEGAFGGVPSRQIPVALQSPGHQRAAAKRGRQRRHA
jgi:hypothetical protein